MNFHKHEGEENPYVWFGYVPLTIFNHTRGQVPVSMNADTINMIHKSKQSAKEGSSFDPEGDFRKSKEQEFMNKYSNN